MGSSVASVKLPS